MSEHSLIGASSCKRFINCPGSIQLITKLGVKSKSSIYSVEGTVAHSLAEDALKKRKSIKMIKKDIGKIIEEEGYKITVTEEMVDAIITYVYLILSDLKKSFYGQLYIEQKFNIDIDPDARGTNDACILEPFTKLTVYDFKYGKGVKVSAYDNLQLKYYALGALNLGDFKEVELVIVQPRISEDEKISRFTLTEDDLYTFRDELKLGIAATREENPPLNSGDWCQFCPAILKCPSYMTSILEITKGDFTDLDAEQLTPIESISTQNYGKMLENCNKVSIWIKNFQKFIEDKAINEGEKIEGHKVVKSWGHKKWKEGTEDLLLPFGADKIYKQELQTPAKLEKVVGKEFIEKNTFRPDNGLVLVSNSDKREPWGGDKTIDTDFEIV